MQKSKLKLKITKLMIRERKQYKARAMSKNSSARMKSKV
jgi:hypothetical protein